MLYCMKDSRINYYEVVSTMLMDWSVLGAPSII